MAFLCRVVPQRENLQAVAGDDEAARRIKAGRCFHTIAHVQPIRAVWKYHHPHVSPSPLRDATNTRDVHFVERGTTTFVRLPATDAETAPGSSSDLAAHQWVQLTLDDLGRELGDDQVVTEYDYPGARVDVLWGRFKFAWEVDLTLPSPTKQERRAHIRENAGYRFLSVVDAQDRRAQLARFATVPVRKLDENARKGKVLARLLVNGMCMLGAGHSQWEQWKGVTLREFCRLLTKGEISYGKVPGCGGNSDYGWTTRKDIARYQDEQKRAQLLTHVRTERVRVESEYNSRAARVSKMNEQLASLATLQEKVLTARESECASLIATAGLDSSLGALQSAATEYRSARVRRFFGIAGALEQRFLATRKQMGIDIQARCREIGREREREQRETTRVLTSLRALAELEEQYSRGSAEQVVAWHAQLASTHPSSTSPTNS